MYVNKTIINNERFGILVCWEVWNEHNASIFNCSEAPSFVVTEKIKGEALTWVLAEVKHLACIIGRT